MELLHGVIVGGLLLILNTKLEAGAEDWHETFKNNLKADKYGQAKQQEIWKEWIENKHLVMRCIDTKEYLEKHKKELTPKKFQGMKDSEKPDVKNTLIGKSLAHHRCLLVFPKSVKTLRSVFELLQGFPKMGFYEVNPKLAGKHTSRDTHVRICFQTKNIEFRLSLDLVNGMIAVKNYKYKAFKSGMPPYLGPGSPTCKLDSVAKKVGSNYFLYIFPLFEVEQNFQCK